MAVRSTAKNSLCFNTQPPEGGWQPQFPFSNSAAVSTHSRPKAAGKHHEHQYRPLASFNTQPPEGGWHIQDYILIYNQTFQHTAARRRLDGYLIPNIEQALVSTHSRPKAAGDFVHLNIRICMVSTHSRPKAAGLSAESCHTHWTVSTHSRPKAAGHTARTYMPRFCVSTHSRPKAAGKTASVSILLIMFQHTAARRRLVLKKSR